MVYTATPRATSPAMMEMVRARKVPRRQVLERREPQQARKERVMVRRPVTRRERLRMVGERKESGERKYVTSNQTPDKEMATPRSMMIRLTEQMVARNMVLHQPRHMRRVTGN